MSGAGTIGVKNSHVFMVVVGFEGMYGELLGLDTVESTTEGAADKAKEFSQTATNISNKGYIPMKLKYGK